MVNSAATRAVQEERVRLPRRQSAAVQGQGNTMRSIGFRVCERDNCPQRALPAPYLVREP